MSSDLSELLNTLRELHQAHAPEVDFALIEEIVKIEEENPDDRSLAARRVKAAVDAALEAD